MPFQMKKSLVKATNGTFLYPWAEFAMGRVCNGPRLLWAEMSRNRFILLAKYREYCCHLDISIGIGMGVGMGLSHTLKFYDKVFLSDGQGAVR